MGVTEMDKFEDILLWDLEDVMQGFVVQDKVSDEGSSSIVSLDTSLVVKAISWEVESGLQGVEEELGRRGLKMS